MGTEGGIGVHGGIGILGISTVVVLLLILVYPSYWVWRLPSLHASSVDIMQTRAWLALSAVSTLAIIPTSFGDVGWVFVPLSLALIALVYAGTHGAVSTALAAVGGRLTMSQFLGFLLVPSVLGVLVVVVSVSQVARAAAHDMEGMDSLASPIVLTFVILGLLPCVLAAGHIVWKRVSMRTVD